jgi:ABC-2 type transport system ATP-binding protein
MPVIEVDNLSKRYGDQVAVDDLSFTIEKGEIFGILGPNGAGKTTTVEIIEGLRTPDRGTVRVLGLDPQRDGEELRRRVGVQLQESELPEQMKVWEALDLYSSFYDQPADWERLLDELTTGLGPQARRDTWELIEQIRDRGVTVVLVTHFMEEAERLAYGRRGSRSITAATIAPVPAPVTEPITTSPG